MTYRKMDEQQRKDLEQKETAVPILAENSSMIKRPIILYPDTSLTLGFDEELISEKL
jgi:arsenate reductase-like glutaredoxin family protein